MVLGAIKNKLVHIFLPLLLLTAAFVALYSLANWFFVMDTGWVPLDRDIANFWLPVALGCILAGTLIAPRLRILKLNEKRNAPFFYWVVAAAVLIAPTCFAQYYLTTASGVLTHVTSAAMIASAPRTKYYATAAVCVNRQNTLVRHENQISGRQNEYLDFKLYLLVPVCVPTGQPVWIGLTYTHSMDSSASDASKTAEYRDFLQHSQSEFDAFDFTRVRYFELLGRTTDRRSYEKALPKAGAASQSLPIILIPHLDEFNARNGQMLSGALDSFGIAAGVFLFMLLIPSLDREKLADARKPRGERMAAERSIWLALLIPSRDAYGLPILIDINLAVYLAMVFSGLGVVSFQADDLLAWGGNYGPALRGFGAYRLISSQFVHAGIMHIAANLYGLAIGGLFLSPVIRKAGLIACYLVCGLGGAIASVTLHPATISIGASGAIMGLWGIVLMLALLGDKRIVAARWAVVMNCLTFAGLTLAAGAIVPGIDNAAHIGGLSTGLVIGLLMFLFSWKRNSNPVR